MFQLHAQACNRLYFRLWVGLARIQLSVASKSVASWKTPRTIARSREKLKITGIG